MRLLGAMQWLSTTTPRRGSKGCRCMIIWVIELVVSRFHHKDVPLSILSINGKLCQARDTSPNLCI